LGNQGEQRLRNRTFTGLLFGVEWQKSKE
jgi:hypothetical protein